MNIFRHNAIAHLIGFSMGQKNHFYTHWEMYVYDLIYCDINFTGSKPTIPLRLARAACIALGLAKNFIWVFS